MDSGARPLAEATPAVGAAPVGAMPDVPVGGTPTAPVGATPAAPVGGTPAARPKARVPWIDTGRGIAIVLVALFHATNWLFDAGFDLQVWKDVNETLSSLRMPLFFTLSGVFAPKWVHAAWRALWRSKLSLFLWVFLLWETIGSAVFLLGLQMKDVGFSIPRTVLALAISPVQPRFELWFIWALALFFVVAKLTARVPRAVQLGVSAAVAMVALAGVFDVNVGWNGFAKYYFFFLAGIYLKPVVIRFGEVSRWWLLALVLAGWAAISAALVLLDLRGIVGLYFLNCVAGVFGGVVLSRLLQRVTLLRHLGRNTLPIYLTHTPLILLICPVLALPAVFDVVRPAELALPALLAATVIALSLGIHRWVGGSPLRLLYEPPRLLVEGPRPPADRTSPAAGVHAARPSP